MASDSKDDWEMLSLNCKDTVYYKKNVNLRFEIEYNEAGTHRERFEEPWANKHPHPNATSYWCRLYYGSTLIDTYILVSVDGGRALLPLPQTAVDLIINPLIYKVAQLFDSMGTLNQYIRRSGLLLES